MEWRFDMEYTKFVKSIESQITMIHMDIAKINDNLTHLNQHLHFNPFESKTTTKFSHDIFNCGTIIRLEEGLVATGDKNDVLWISKI